MQCGFIFQLSVPRPVSRVGHMLFVPDIFALKRTNGIEEISRYFDFDR